MKRKKIYIATMVGCCFALIGCFNDENDAPSTGSTPPLTQDSTPLPIPDDIITFEEFMQEHSDEALAFANAYAKNDLLDNKTPLSQTWGFHADENEKLDSVSLTFTYASGDYSRVVEVANMTFVNPIQLNDIVEEKTFTADELDNDISRELAFEFDAKEVFMNADFASTLCEYVSEGEGATYFKEVENEGDGIRVFQIAEETTSAINVYQLRVVGETDEEVVKNLKVSYNNELIQTATYPLGDKESATIVLETYQAEEFAPENVDEAIKDYNLEIANALGTHFLPVVGKKAYGSTFDADKLESYSWDIGDGETISQIKLISNYDRYEDSNMIVVENVNLKNPIVIKELTKENIDQTFASSIEEAEFEKEYVTAYNPQIQGTRDALVNAIFKAYGHSEECPEGAVRYFVDDGSTLDSDVGESHRFKVIEITDSGIKQFTILIKSSLSDEEYISKLSNNENYLIFDEKSCEMTGKKISVGIFEEESTEEDSNESTM